MGKILGGLIGLIFLGPLGLVIGAIAGHFFIDGRRRTQGSGSRAQFFSGGFGRAQMFHQIQEMYFKLFFSMLGKMAKADGNVTKQEGDYFLDILQKMNLSSDARTRAITYFNEAKNTNTEISHMAQQFNQLCSGQPQLKQQMLHQLIGIAGADGKISSAEEVLIKQVAHIFSISEEILDHLFSSVGSSSDASYHILGVSQTASDEEVKKAYRKIVKEYHPDILKSKGLPKELMKDAEKRFHKIQEAWNAIKKERSITD